jgi:hypothetical protein
MKVNIKWGRIVNYGAGYCAQAHSSKAILMRIAGLRTHIRDRAVRGIVLFSFGTTQDGPSFPCPLAGAVSFGHSQIQTGPLTKTAAGEQPPGCQIYEVC